MCVHKHSWKHTCSSSMVVKGQHWDLFLSFHGGGWTQVAKFSRLGLHPLSSHPSFYLPGAVYPNCAWAQKPQQKIVHIPPTYTGFLLNDASFLFHITWVREAHQMQFQWLLSNQHEKQPQQGPQSRSPCTLTIQSLSASVCFCVPLACSWELSRLPTATVCPIPIVFSLILGLFSTPISFFRSFHHHDI